MPPLRIDFREAFDRWHRITDQERQFVDEQTKKSATRLSWEALDHLCGISVEAGMKALLIHTGLVTRDASGDYPPDADGRRPHVDELWDIFMARASSRRTAHLLADLGGASQLRIFQTWRSTHRYASDGSVADTVVAPRLAFLKRLRGVISQEIP